MRINALPVLAALALLLTACGPGRLERLPPAGLVAASQVLVFADGMHSGVVLDKTPAIAALDPQTEGVPAGYPFMEVGFAADEWIVAQEPGCCAKLSLAFGSSRGVLYLVQLPSFERPPREAGTPIRTWTLQLSAEARRRLEARIAGWVDGEAPLLLRPPARTTTMRYVNRRWAVSHNCHDFTVDVLRAAGLELEIRSIYDNDRFADEMDEAVRQLAAGAITVVGPAP